MESRKITGKILKIAFPFILGGGLLYWMYRDFDFSQFNKEFMSSINWWWMSLSLVFGMTAQLFRGLRWRQTLEPLGEYPRTSTCVYSIFVSYALSLVIPRIGEVSRCGILRKYDGTSFTKSLGTVVTERVIDLLLMLFMVGLTIVLQLSVFSNFFSHTGTNLHDILGHFSAAGYAVSIALLIVTVVFFYWLFRKLSISSKLRGTINNLKAGVLSLKDVKNKWLFAFYTIMIWVSYFIHYSLTFLCFDFMSGLGWMAALVSFIVGSISVIVPTPNGAGSWHFSVKTILVLYGISATNAAMFVLVVHTIQTALIPLLGIYGFLMLQLNGKRAASSSEEISSEEKK